MVGKLPFITETSTYNKLDVLIESRLIRFADHTEPGRAGGVLSDGFKSKMFFPKCRYSLQQIRGCSTGMLTHLMKLAANCATARQEQALQKWFVFDGESEGEWHFVS